MGFGGGIITRKLLFAVLLVAGMSLFGIAGVSAADVGTAQKQSGNHYIMQKITKTDVKHFKILNKSAKTQNSVDKIVKHVKNAYSSKQIVTPNKNTVKHKKTHKAKKTIKFTNNTANTIANQKATVKSHISQNSTNTVSIQSTSDNAKINDEKAAAGEPKTKVTTSNTTEKVLAAGSPPTSKVPASLKKYTKATKNCQVNNSKIKALAKKITKGKKTKRGKAAAIFKWVRDNLGYSFYYNTRKGAVGALKARTANCADTAHLVIALERAAGIPARYVHGKAQFRSGHVYGHVWAEVYVNGKWYKADATSSRNSFGVVKSWTSAKIKGKYASLPF